MPRNRQSVSSHVSGPQVMVRDAVNTRAIRNWVVGTMSRFCTQ